jgi:type IV secretory pathway VirB9-like protein
VKNWAVFIVAVILALGTASAGSAAILDEGATGALPDRAIANRPLRTDANLQAVQAAFDKSDPRENVERFQFSPDMTYKLRLREFMHTSVVLPEWENINAFSLGDETNFTLLPLNQSPKNQGANGLKNIFEVWGRYHGADTNLTVYGTSGNIYSFYLRNDSTESPFLPNLVVYIEDDRPKVSPLIEMEVLANNAKATGIVNENTDITTTENSTEQEEYLKELPLIDPSNLNFNYRLKGGDKDLAPIRVFDDGFFTYFQFAESGVDIKKLPVVYRVVDDFDTPVNNRVEKGTVIVEAVNPKWTLRSGGAHLCVWAKNK